MFDKGRLLFWCCDILRWALCRYFALVRTTEIAQVFTKVLVQSTVRRSQWYIFVHAVGTDSSRDVLDLGRGLFLPISQSLHASIVRDGSGFTKRPKDYC